MPTAPQARQDPRAKLVRRDPLELQVPRVKQEPQVPQEPLALLVRPVPQERPDKDLSSVRSSIRSRNCRPVPFLKDNSDLSLEHWQHRILTTVSFICIQVVHGHSKPTCLSKASKDPQARPAKQALLVPRVPQVLKEQQEPRETQVPQVQMVLQVQQASQVLQVQMVPQVLKDLKVLWAQSVHKACQVTPVPPVPQERLVPWEIQVLLVPQERLEAQGRRVKPEPRVIQVQPVPLARRVLSVRQVPMACKAQWVPKVPKVLSVRSAPRVPKVLQEQRVIQEQLEPSVQLVPMVL